MRNGKCKNDGKNAAKAMQAGPISKDQARELGRVFLDVAHALATYRFDCWNDMTASDRKRIEEEEWNLLRSSSSLGTAAVGVILDQLGADLPAIVSGAGQAGKVVETLRDVKAVVKIGAAFAALGGAIASGNPVAIAAAAAAAAGTVEAARSAS